MNASKESVKGTPGEVTAKGLHELLTGNAVIGQAGGPTAVINQSLVGVIESLRFGLHACGRVKKIYGMRHGVKGFVKGDLVDMTNMHQDHLDRLAATPSACLGSTRDKPDEAYCERILEACKKHDIRYFFYIGGNDSSDTCRIVRDKAQQAGYELRCFHVPKTVDNDLMENDHCPGFPSAARYVALACMADFLDNVSLPGIKINVVMGRHAGFLTGASALARRHDWEEPLESTDGPQLIYLPEVPFDLDRFVADVDKVYSKKGRCHIAMSEGVVDEKGNSIGAKLIKNAQTDSHGNVQLSGSGSLGDSLGDLLKEKLTPTGGKAPRVRADTFGYAQRCWPDPSVIDQREARRVGRHAAAAAMRGELSGSVTITRCAGHSGARGESYMTDFGLVKLEMVAGKTRLMPKDFISGHHNVSRKFVEYCLPLVGELPTFERL
ncbi:MAG TPA: diphosphate--fructose-6-phosphate 1-phosphotransferase [Phycisphaerales bacterium]|nr:diphosphate--fructose-6-phosphate 1-phosphotransferase [Phycisphaerales bacterium]